MITRPTANTYTLQLLKTGKVEAAHLTRDAVTHYLNFSAAQRPSRYIVFPTVSGTGVRGDRWLDPISNL